jgi:hypothetical protein
LPAQLGNAAFWRLSETASEAGGEFHSENYVSNEGRYQAVIPELLRRVQPGGLYLGVGPEQNFSYIAALRPRMAIILDIRRGNLQEHLLYKAVMELSVDRADFLSKLFGRSRPAGLTSRSSVDELFAAYGSSSASEDVTRRTWAAIADLLTRQRALPLPPTDLHAIEFIYRNVFVAEGPALAYRRTDGSPFVGPSYALLMTRTDDAGVKRSYLASEENFHFLKNLQSRNLLVPVVGDFGGPKALRAIGAYARSVNARVAAFYVSNVESYLRGDGKQNAFLCSVASLPLDATSTFIRSAAGTSGRSEANNLAFFGTALGSMADEARTCVP